MLTILFYVALTASPAAAASYLPPELRADTPLPTTENWLDEDAVPAHHESSLWLKSWNPPRAFGPTDKRPGISLWAVGGDRVVFDLRLGMNRKYASNEEKLPADAQAAFNQPITRQVGAPSPDEDDAGSDITQYVSELLAWHRFVYFVVLFD
ncbi:MAG: hypothetical protein P9L99_20565 [Candidatus Lernaella stagnicola]|nr:hypothetical protein [Candidatus Lernaella stagnicola]